MIIEVKRTYHKEFTSGELFVNGLFNLYTLEDSKCIPEGTYDLVINRSSRFNKQMPLITNVPGFSGVRIHSGNNVKDTQGCLLVGYIIDTNIGILAQSRMAYDALFSRLLKKHLGGEPIQIKIYEKKV